MRPTVLYLLVAEGRHDYTEYRLALGELDRMNRSAAAAH